MATHRHNIPPSWTIAPLGDIADSITKGATPTSYGYTFQTAGINFIRIENVTNGNIDTSTIRDFISLAAHENQKRSILKPDDILFSIAGTIGEIAIVEARHLPANTNQAFGIISGFSRILLPRFLAYQFRSFVSSDIKQRARGGAMNNVSLEDLRELDIVIPPLSEQRRIVLKLDELVSELDKGIDSLRISRDQLHAYTHAVLKHAFEGKLTAQWREENRCHLSSADSITANLLDARETRKQQRKPAPQAPAMSPTELSSLPRLPEGWIYMRLGAFVDEIQAGKSFKCDEREPSVHEIGVAKVSAVTWGEYDESESKTCLDPNRNNPRYYIKSGDFLLSRANTIELVGACVIVKEVTKRVMLSDKTLRLQFRGGNKQYFLHYLRSRTGRNEIMRHSTGNQESMRNIGQDRILRIVVPVCASAEMAEICRRLDEIMIQVQAAELAIASEMLRAEVLRQSILTSAFSGRLIQQNPEDEPAVTALERLRAERNGLKKSVSTTKPRKKRKTAA